MQWLDAKHTSDACDIRIYIHGVLYRNVLFDFSLYELLLGAPLKHLICDLIASAIESKSFTNKCIYMVILCKQIIHNIITTHYTITQTYLRTHVNMQVYVHLTYIIYTYHISYHV